MLKALLRGDSGQDLIEYALICALVALGCVAATGSLGTKIGSQFDAIGNTLSSLSAPGGSAGAGSSGTSGTGSSKSGGSKKGGKKKKKG